MNENRHRVGDTVRFREHGHAWWTGVITAIRPDHIYVRWSDDVIGTFNRKHAHRLETA